MTTNTLSDNMADFIQDLRLRRQTEKSLPCGLTTPDESVDTSLDEPLLRREVAGFGLVELLLKNQPRLHRQARSVRTQKELIPGLIMIGVAGYAIFALVLAIVFSCALRWPALTPLAEWLKHRSQLPVEMVPIKAGGILNPWRDGSALHLTAAFTFGLIASIGVCLPSFYFYGLLSGVRTTLLQVTTNAVTGLASGAVAVLGALPIYLAVILGLIIFQAPDLVLNTACALGLVLPFITGLYGTRALAVGFLDLIDTLPSEQRDNRRLFLGRLLLAWSACYTVVTPVMIYTVWESLSR